MPAAEAWREELQQWFNFLPTRGTALQTAPTCCQVSSTSASPGASSRSQVPPASMTWAHGTAKASVSYCMRRFRGSTGCMQNQLRFCLNPASPAPSCPPCPTWSGSHQPTVRSGRSERSTSTRGRCGTAAAALAASPAARRSRVRKRSTARSASSRTPAASPTCGQQHEREVCASLEKHACHAADRRLTPYSSYIVAAVAQPLHKAATWPTPCPFPRTHRQHGVEDVAEGAAPHAHHAARVLQAHRHQRLQHRLPHAALGGPARAHAACCAAPSCILLIHHQAGPLPGKHLLVHHILQVLRHAAAAATAG